MAYMIKDGKRTLSLREDEIIITDEDSSFYGEIVPSNQGVIPYFKTNKLTTYKGKNNGKGIKEIKIRDLRGGAYK